jgi:bifunctional polynucleotide phosphatase/kinase
MDNLIIFDTNIFISNKTNNLKLACFDLDYTLIKPKGKNKFPKNKDDWVLLNNVKNILNLYSKDYIIIIFSNQNINTKMNYDDHLYKCDKISNELDIPITFYFSLEKDIMRKPRIGMWDYMINNKFNNIGIDINNSFYCGDALGRSDDFADTDLKFALNIGLNIYSPEQLFSKKKLMDLSNINNNNLINNIIFKPQLYFKKPKKLNIKQSNNREVIIIVGCPASGKSNIVSTYFNTYTVISQDIEKTKNNCIKKLKNTLINSNDNIIIDNTNRTIESREVWISLIKESKVNIDINCIFINIEKHICFHLNMFRKLTTNKNIPDIVIHAYFKQLEEPDYDEGFDNIYEINYSYVKKNNNNLLFQYLL